MTSEVNYRDIFAWNEGFDVNQNINALKIIECPTISVAHNLLVQNWFQEKVENTLTLNEISFVITEGVSDSTLPRSCPRSFINRNFMISFEILNIDSFEVYWTVDGNFHKIDLTTFNIELRNFVIDHLRMSLESNDQGKIELLLCSIKPAICNFTVVRKLRNAFNRAQ